MFFYVPKNYSKLMKVTRGPSSLCKRRCMLEKMISLQDAWRNVFMA